MKLKTTNLLIIGLLSFSLVSCTQEVTDALAENQPTDQQGQGQEQGQGPGQGPGQGQGPGDFDQQYASTMQDNFQGYQMEEGDDCFHMYDDQNQSEYRLPPRRPKKKGSEVSQNGMAVDGSKINKGQSGWEFDTPPDELVSNRGNGRIIGVHGDGAPIYGKYANSDDQDDLDENGGKYGPTQDFPEGIYHYVVTINFN